MSELTEKQVIAALARLSRGWPKDLWLCSFSGTLSLVRKVDGEKAMRGDEFDMDYSIADFGGIENDGCG